MNAAAQTEPVPALFFFTTIRIVFTVAIYPILFSFLITAYINRRNKDEKAKGSASDDLKGLENKVLSFNSPDDISKDYKFKKFQRLIESPQDIKNALHRSVRNVFEKRYGFDSVLDRDSRDMHEDEEGEDAASVGHSSSDATNSFSIATSNTENFSDIGMVSNQAQIPSKRIKSVAKLWMSHDKLTTKEMFDSYTNGSLMLADTVDKDRVHEQDSHIRTRKASDSLMSKKTHESMMSHWSGGQEALTAGEKVKKKEGILKKLLQVTMQNIASEREETNSMLREITVLKRKVVSWLIIPVLRNYLTMKKPN
jgi:hypothetical protein